MLLTDYSNKHMVISRTDFTNHPPTLLGHHGASSILLENLLKLVFAQKRCTKSRCSKSGTVYMASRLVSRGGRK